MWQAPTWVIFASSRYAGVWGIEIVSDGASVISENTEKSHLYRSYYRWWYAGTGLSPSKSQVREIEAGQKFHAHILSYPEALCWCAPYFSDKIAVAGAHGKSTTSAMIGTILHDLQGQGTTITGTLVKAFDGKISPQRAKSWISRRVNIVMHFWNTIQILLSWPISIPTIWISSRPKQHTSMHFISLRGSEVSRYARWRGS